MCIDTPPAGQFVAFGQRGYLGAEEPMTVERELVAIGFSRAAKQFVAIKEAKP
jgi:hypothetical protein